MKKKRITREVIVKKKGGVIKTPPFSVTDPDNFISHEEANIASIFIEDTPIRDLSIDPVAPPIAEESYEPADYGFSKDKSLELWEAIGKAKSEEFHDVMIQVLATMDAFKRTQDYINQTFQAEILFVNDKLTNEIANLLLAKLKTIILDDLDFDAKQYEELFSKFVTRPDKSLAELLKVPREEHPYGALGFAKGLKND